jgi:hypothetical protein
LATAPEKPEKNKKQQPVPRAKSAFHKPHSTMPDVECGQYLLDILYEIGPVSSNGFGAAPVSELELLCWQLNRGVRLSPWECETVMRLSREYASMTHQARDPYCPPPFGGVVRQDADQRRHVMEQFEKLSAQLPPKHSPQKPKR